MNQITDQDINAKLLQWAGIVLCDKWYGILVGIVAKGDCGHEQCCDPDYAPRYTESLDSIATLEAKLSDEQKVFYAATLYNICVAEDVKHPDHFISFDIAFTLISATAPQRALALVRALGLEEGV